MELDEAFTKYVIRGEWAEPEELLSALAPHADIEGGRGVWIRYQLLLAYHSLNNLPAFMEVSERFCFVDPTHSVDFSTAKQQALVLRIQALRTNGKGFDREAEALLRLSPPPHQLRVLKGTRFFDSPSSEYTFGPNQRWTASEYAWDQSWEATPIKLYHPSVDSQKAPVSPVVSAVDSVEVIYVNSDYAAFRERKVYEELSNHEVMMTTREQLRDEGRKPDALGGVALILSDLFDGSNYCHWTFDWFPRLMIAEAAGEHVDFVCLRGAGGQGQRNTLRRYCKSRGIKVIDTNETMWLGFDRLVTVDNNKIASTHPAWVGHPLVVHSVRNFFLKGRQAKARRRIYISRNDAKARRVLNEDAVFASLQELGFERVILSGMSPVEQAKLFSTADCCVSPHGAGMTNIIFMPEGSMVVELFHNRGGTSGFVPVARTLGHRYAYLTCGSSAEDRPEDHEPFTTRLVRYHDAPLWVDLALLRPWLEERLTPL